VPKAALSKTANANGVERYTRRLQHHEREGTPGSAVLRHHFL